MALVFSVWDDNATHMLWLDGEEFPLNSTKPGVHRGPCPVEMDDLCATRRATFCLILHGSVRS